MLPDKPPVATRLEVPRTTALKNRTPGWSSVLLLASDYLCELNSNRYLGQHEQETVVGPAHLDTNAVRFTHEDVMYAARPLLSTCIS